MFVAQGDLSVFVAQINSRYGEEKEKKERKKKKEKKTTPDKVSFYLISHCRLVRL